MTPAIRGNRHFLLTIEVNGQFQTHREEATNLLTAWYSVRYHYPKYRLLDIRETSQNLSLNQGFIA